MVVTTGAMIVTPSPCLFKLSNVTTSTSIPPLTTPTATGELCAVIPNCARPFPCLHLNHQLQPSHHCLDHLHGAKPRMPLSLPCLACNTSPLQRLLLPRNVPGPKQLNHQTFANGPSLATSDVEMPSLPPTPCNVMPARL